MSDYNWGNFMPDMYQAKVMEWVQIMCVQVENSWSRLGGFICKRWTALEEFQEKILPNRNVPWCLFVISVAQSVRTWSAVYNVEKMPLAFTCVQALALFHLLPITYINSLIQPQAHRHLHNWKKLLPHRKPDNSSAGCFLSAVQLSVWVYNVGWCVFCEISKCGRENLKAAHEIFCVP